GARYYDSDVARFLSLDPLAANYAGWSAYNYVMGNPISLVDPTGRSATKWEDEKGNTIAENKDGNNQVIAVMDEARGRFDDAVSEAKGKGVFDTRGGTEDINRATWNFTMKSWGTTGYFADQSLGANFTSSLGNASNAMGLVETGLVLGGELHQESLFAQGFRLACNGENILLKGRNLSLFGEISPAPLSRLSGWGRTAGRVGTVLGLASVGAEWYDYNQGRVSGARFAYHTTGTGASMLTGALAGGPAGFAVGAGFYVGEKGYDAMWYLAGQMSAIDHKYSRMWLGW
ncbi:MAG: hypothetical protein JST66_07370, partial [Bacteroidetes bacterium]|nr:hypothetical protein [Bacteroidota bacterium]